METIGDVEFRDAFVRTQVPPRHASQPETR
jgi:hypothetical protein